MGTWSFPCNVLMSLIINQSFPCNLLVSLFINKLFQTLNMIMLYSNTVSNKNVVQKKKKRKRANRDMQNTTQKTQDRGTRTPTTLEDELRSTCGNRCLINDNRIGQTYSKLVCYNEIYFFFWPLCCFSICLFCLPLWYLQTLLR